MTLYLPNHSSCVFAPKNFSRMMKQHWWWRRRWWVPVAVAVFVMAKTVNSDPQTNLLNRGSSQHNATDALNFFNNLNLTFSDIRNQLANQNKHFAMAQQARSSDPVYAVAQCRYYLSTADCVSCFDTAVARIRNCSAANAAANGARVTCDVCFLRYESNSFFDQTTLPGNVGICGNQTAPQATAFDAAASGLLVELRDATPRINGFFAATTREVAGGGTVYGVAQCAETVTSSGCQDCLRVAYSNIQGCPPNLDGTAVDGGCFLRYSATPFFAKNQTSNMAAFLGGGSLSKKKATVGGVVGGGRFLVLMITLFLWYYLSREPKKTQRGKQCHGNIVGATELQGQMTYKYKDLKDATKNFSKATKLGEGGFGDVYKGTLRNGDIVAVKKLAITSKRVEAEFESEVRLISNVHHRNLIRLLGCCNKGLELLLIYEYMANGSLDKFLYGEKRGKLNWKQRFDIIFGTARGLAYLHDQFHVCIIHRDIKSSNILLDDEFQPKIADFGLARLLPEDKTHISTQFAGNLGYTAPEYALHGQLSEKVDTYSFGVVVLEIVSGRRNNHVKVEVEPVTEYLLEQAWKLYEKGMHLELVDETLNPNEYKAEDVKKIIEIALVCTQSPVFLRPAMSDVVVMLLSDQSAEQRTPSWPTFADSDKRVRGDTLISTGSSMSHATASFTDFTGR